MNIFFSHPRNKHPCETMQKTKILRRINDIVLKFHVFRYVEGFIFKKKILTKKKSAREKQSN